MTRARGDGDGDGSGDRSGGNSGSGGGSGNRDEPPQQQLGTTPVIAVDRVAARLILAGLTGSAAAVGAAVTGAPLAPRWGDAASLAAAAPLFAPLVAANLFLLAPRWRAPALLLVEADDGAMTAGEQQPTTAGQRQQQQQPPPIDLDKVEAAGWGAPALQLALAAHQRACLVAPGRGGRPPLAVSRWRAPGAERGQTGMQLFCREQAVAICMHALIALSLVTQHHHRCNAQVEAPLVAARVAGAELLRAFGVLFAGGWVADRAIEAGAAPFVPLPAPLAAALLGASSEAASAPDTAAVVAAAATAAAAAVEVPLGAVTRAAAALLLTLAAVPLAAVVAAEAQELAAAALVLETEAGRDAARLKARAAQQRRPVRRRASGVDSSGGGANSDDAGTAAARQSAGTATLAALDALLPAVRDEEDGEEEALDALVVEYRLQLASERCAKCAPAQAASWAAFARSLARAAVANAALVASGGNVAALLLGAAALDGVALACAVANGGGGDDEPAAGDGGGE